MIRAAWAYWLARHRVRRHAARSGQQRIITCTACRNPYPQQPNRRCPACRHPQGPPWWHYAVAIAAGIALGLCATLWNAMPWAVR